MFSRSLAVLALSVCILLTMANTGYAGYLFPRQTRSVKRDESSCCGIKGMESMVLCPMAMECCPGLRTSLLTSEESKGNFACVKDLISLIVN